MKPLAIIITQARLQRAAGKLDAVNRFRFLEVYSKKLDNNIIFTLMDNGVTFHTLYYESPILP